MDTREKPRIFLSPPHFNALRILKVPLHVHSYKELLTLVQETTRQGNGKQAVWKDLDEWVTKKYGGTIQTEESKKKKSRPLQHDVSQLTHVMGGDPVGRRRQGRKKFDGKLAP